MKKMCKKQKCWIVTFVDDEEEFETRAFYKGIDAVRFASENFYKVFNMVKEKFGIPSTFIDGGVRYSITETNSGFNYEWRIDKSVIE